MATTPLDILQAGLEGVAYRLALVYRQLRPALPVEPEIIASGAALFRSPAWSQIVADVLGKAIRVGSGEQASARGAALLAMEALGWRDWAEEMPPEDNGGRLFEPDPGRHAVYERAIERQQALYDLLRPLRQT
jgi:gluconokinase